jgi:hypothetical protein
MGFGDWPKVHGTCAISAAGPTSFDVLLNNRLSNFPAMLKNKRKKIVLLCEIFHPSKAHIILSCLVASVDS